MLRELATVAAELELDDPEALKLLLKLARTLASRRKLTDGPNHH